VRRGPYVRAPGEEVALCRAQLSAPRPVPDSTIGTRSPARAQLAAFQLEALVARIEPFAIKIPLRASNGWTVRGLSTAREPNTGLENRGAHRPTV